MKATLTYILSALQGAATLSYIRDNDIFITPDVDYVPRQTKMPCIGVKDGAIRYDLDSEGALSNMGVSIAVFAEIHRDEESSIVGDGISKGVLEIAEDVADVLHNNLLGGILGEIAKMMKDMSLA